MDKISEPAAPAVTPSDALVAAGHAGPTAGDQAAAAKGFRYELMRSAIYHDIRADWLGRANRWSLFLTLILGSGAVAALGAQLPTLGQVSGLFVAAVSALSLVWDFSGQARTHTDLKRQFYRLLADLEDGVPPEKVRAQERRLFAEEPPALRVVMAMAENWAGGAIYGDDFDRHRIGFFRRATAHFFPWADAAFQPSRKP
ncbi:hypothetical protein NX862_18950 [Rhodobacter sp. KR11]|uniref:hypothetical protein n=1 Tax=Rhodobacter sp. KR11 TaxID=2974588 RepID=UPI00222260F5|nr:hypothetical protein [Rhodobacter sp. KR11]MCW1920842.1 hypothetical protein [Rhodobacter sp. KR11]